MEQNNQMISNQPIETPETQVAKPSDQGVAKKRSLILPIILVFPIVIIVTLAGCFLQKDQISMYPQADQDILLYLKENYPSHEFDLIVDYSIGRPILSYIATEKSGKYLTASVDYNMESREIISDAIPAALIAIQFDDFISNKLREAFPNSKVYREKKRIDFNKWRLWDLYEFNLENYIEYFFAVERWPKNSLNWQETLFYVVVDSKDFPDKLKQIKTFFSYSEDYKYKYNYHYIKIRLLYVPTEYFNQPIDEYFTGDVFSKLTDFYKAVISDEIVSVNIYKRQLELNKGFGKGITIID